MKKTLKIAILGLIINLSANAAAQEEEGSFEYSGWKYDGYEAHASTLVNDAENRLIILCGTGHSGIMTDHRLIVASDDDGSVPDIEWGNTVKRGTITTTLRDGRKAVTPIKLYVRDDDGPYGPILGFEPTNRRGEWYDASDAALLTSLTDATSIVVALAGRGQNIKMSFGASGSKRAIGAMTWCSPSNSL